MYVLEVQAFLSGIAGERDDDGTNGHFQHVGYMEKVFTSKPEACRYYDKHNPHMRSLNARKTYRSDWDPESRLRYVVREFSGECRSVDSWGA